MADIYYLRPTAKQAANANLVTPVQDDHGHLAIMLSLPQLAAVLLKETVMIGGIASPRLSDLIAKLNQAAAGTSNPTPAAGSPFSRRPTVYSAKSGSASEEPLAAQKIDALLAEGVSGGNIRLGAQQRLHTVKGGAHPGAVKMLADHVGVPPDILLARQNRTGQAAFSFANLTAAENALNTVFRNNLMMIRGWAERGGRPPLHVRLQSKEPLGIIAHAGADEVTELRGIAVSFETERVLSAPWIKVSMSLTAPTRR